MTERFSEFISSHNDTAGWHVTLGGAEGSRFVGHGPYGLAAHLDAERKIEAGTPDYFDPVYRFDKSEG